MGTKATKALASTLVACVSLWILAACKEEEPRPPVGDPGNNNPPPGGGSTSSSGSTGDGGSLPSDSGSSGTIDDSGDAANACTQLVISGGVIDQVAVNGDVPAGTGGDIAVGTYDLTDARFYTGPTGVPGLTGNSFQGTIVITDGLKLERALVSQTAGNVRTETRVTGTIIPSGVNGVTSLTCPFTTQEQFTYTSTGNLLTISNLVTKESVTYSKKL